LVAVKAILNPPSSTCCKIPPGRIVLREVRLHRHLWIAKNDGGRDLRLPQAR
jgi:hypothetical protein